MGAKLFVILTTLAVAASASVIHTPEPDLTSFAYDVADPNTGDFKSQIETRIGGNVRGQYSLLESDGTRRVVDYSAGDEGFNAVVRNDPVIISEPIIKTAEAAPAPALIASDPPSAVYASKAAVIPPASAIVGSSPAFVAPVAEVVAFRPAISSYSTDIVTFPEVIAKPAVISSKTIFPSYSRGVSDYLIPSLYDGRNAPSLYASSDYYPSSYTYANTAPKYSWWEK